MVQVVKLADRGETAFQHLHVGEGSNRLDVVGRQSREKPVHHGAPRPEAVGGAAALGEPGHGALERMAVQVRQSGKRDAGDPLGAVGGRARLHRNDHTIGHLDAHIARPAGGQQCVIEYE